MVGRVVQNLVGNSLKYRSDEAAAEAYGGAIVAGPAPDGGTAMRFSLPD